MQRDVSVAIVNSVIVIICSVDTADSDFPIDDNFVVINK